MEILKSSAVTFVNWNSKDSCNDQRVIFVKVIKATEETDKSRTFRDRGKCKMKRMQLVNLRDSDCADCRTAHDSEAERSRQRNFENAPEAVQDRGVMPIALVRVLALSLI